jgi:hypothetical protein
MGERDRVGRRAVPGLHQELHQRTTVHRGCIRAEHLEPVQRQAAGHRGEQAAPVGRGDRDPVAVQVHGR